MFEAPHAELQISILEHSEASFGFYIELGVTSSSASAKNERA